IRPILRVLGERGAVVYGHIADIAVFIIIGFVWSGTALLILTPLAALPAVITPALQGIMSKAVGDDAQGELQGALTSVAALAMVISPLVMTASFSVAIGPASPAYLPGAPFFLSAVLMAAALAVFLRAGRRFAIT
ncbi:MAG: tetracycline resistance MFS efflux pump, partial [Pseudomonadota bacterium]